MPILTIHEEHFALGVKRGRIRFQASRNKGYVDRQYKDEGLRSAADKEQDDIDACVTEIAFALYRRVPVDFSDMKEGTLKMPDEDGHQVRSTRHETGGLIMRKKDIAIKHQPFALVVVLSRLHYDICGHALGAEIMQHPWTDRPEYTVEFGPWKMPRHLLTSFTAPVPLQYQSLSSEQRMAQVQLDIEHGAAHQRALATMLRNFPSIPT